MFRLRDGCVALDQLSPLFVSACTAITPPVDVLRSTDYQFDYLSNYYVSDIFQLQKWHAQDDAVAREMLMLCDSDWARVEYFCVLCGLLGHHQLAEFIVCQSVVWLRRKDPDAFLRCL